MTNIADWEGGVGRNWAAQWRRTDATFAQLTPRLLNAIAAEPGRRVVDIGCGAGEVSLAVARARPQAQVIGVDVSPDLVDAARGRAGALPNLSFELADASSWTSPQGAPDLYVSRHGVMFFPDPPAAFAHLASVAAPDARLVFTCFRAAKENAWATGIANLLPPAEVPSLPFPPGPFAFADPEHVRRCLKGWRDLAFTPVDFAYVAGEGEHAVAEAMALFQRIGPSAFALRTLPEAERATFEKRLLEFVEAHHQGGQVTFPAAAWLITATSDHDDG
ncbi:putative methyltransferase [Novosphingobium aromaticivorans DSM 12444]|uniref:Putative methyltransferase n=1 Tax=Novosphingobium aromaticivorans (strain ATCC 700278 / DSM 12444 / CCUG 56034 / CIP 105152 / NBRC 16084 / F199) TaxID=279238 RepID=Q2G8V1_NOVAD|nr:class I SAM-dependent methyltransferase [Novosphingobium aromaticivorans]ABD25722.1 putative methyltransferase [Novosphingobium aromaticivorans DSM 12444]SCY01597.1 Trans-aconitate methyltransferase [Novosphingobium aromaticivorans]